MNRKPRSFREKRSSLPKREPYDLVLIVCEGSKTEPAYLTGLITELRVSSANVVIVGEGASPSTIVASAISRFEKDGGYDSVFCVFDRDQHADYDAALDRCLASRKRNGDKLVQFESIVSNPCFEYWLILHFEETSRPFVPSGGETAAATAVRYLKRYITDYAKGARDIYRTTRPGLDDAIARAGRFRAQDILNPSTGMDQVVSYIRKIKKDSEVP